MLGWPFGLGCMGLGVWGTPGLPQQAAVAPLEPSLNEAEGHIYDSLMVEATGHIERGASLLAAGIKDSARSELARGVTSGFGAAIRRSGGTSDGRSAPIQAVRRIELPPDDDRARVADRPLGAARPRGPRWQRRGWPNSRTSARSRRSMSPSTAWSPGPSRDALVSFEGRLYSVPFAWVGRAIVERNMPRCPAGQCYQHC